MVFTIRVHAGWSRRAVLTGLGAAAAAAAATASGCTWWSDRSDPPPPDPLAPLVATTATLRARYEHAVSAFPDLADRLTPLLSAHRAHEQVLRELTGIPEPTDGPRWAPATSATTDPDSLLAELRAAEETAQHEAEQACLTAPSERAALLGSITAARATHREVLA